MQIRSGRKKSHAPAGGSGVAPQMPQAKTAKLEQFIDPNLLQELETEGFFTELTKRYPNK